MKDMGGRVILVECPPVTLRNLHQSLSPSRVACAPATPSMSSSPRQQLLRLSSLVVALYLQKFLCVYFSSEFCVAWSLPFERLCLYPSTVKYESYFRIPSRNLIFAYRESQKCSICLMANVSCHTSVFFCALNFPTYQLLVETISLYF